MIQGGTERRGWLTLALMSALFFIITAATFDSLGVVLPTMVGELDWSWANAGLGLTLLATVPGTYLLARLFARPAFAIGLYFTVGGLGGVAGPLLYRAVIDITGQWRSYWLVMDALVVLAALTAMLLVDTATDVGSATDSDTEVSTESS